MTQVTLYKAAADYQHKIDLCVDEDGVLDIDKLQAIEGALQERGVAVVAVFKTIAHKIATLDSLAAEIDEQKNRETAKQDRLKAYLQDAMKTAGISKLESNDGLLQASLAIERDVSVEIDEGATFAPELCNPPKPPPPLTPSKTLIKAAIERGEAIAGARIIRKDRLTIK